MKRINTHKDHSVFFVAYYQSVSALRIAFN